MIRMDKAQNAMVTAPVLTTGSVGNWCSRGFRAW